MALMILKMSAVTAAYVILTYFLWAKLRKKRFTPSMRVAVGIIYGICSILSTHFAIDFQDMLLNVRDLGPLSAGLFFDPVSGIIAGLIGGIERYIVGTYFGIGSYTRIACSVSTCLAGFLAAALHYYVFRKRKPSEIYAFILGATMEVFHMYVVFITHRDDPMMAFYVVKICAMPMIIFTGVGLSASALVLRIKSGQWDNPFRIKKDREIRVSQKFQFWLFVVTAIVLSANFALSYMLQTRTALQEAKNDLMDATASVRESFESIKESDVDLHSLTFHIGSDSSYDIMDPEGNVKSGFHQDRQLSRKFMEALFRDADDQGFLDISLENIKCLCRVERLGDDLIMIAFMPTEAVFANRDAQTYEMILADILVFAVIYLLISMLVQSMVVRNLELVNASLHKITEGDLNETVSVYSSSEFASLSQDINQTVDVLKGYIDAAEKRFEQELILARTIQESALPHNFHFDHTDFDIYATMDAAKVVGGDFYDFFFANQHSLALVIADVSGKGIPAALFMMRSKTAIRSLAENGNSPKEVMAKANDLLCDGNDAEMFVTAWIGIIDLENAVMTVANAGHEYPIIKRAGGDYELLKRKHNMALAAMEGLPFGEYELEFHPGDMLFVYTDGVPEAINTETVQYGTDRLLAVLNANKDASPEELLPIVREDLRKFVGEADQFDDVTMLSFRYNGSPAD